jgi:spermidine synthase
VGDDQETRELCFDHYIETRIVKSPPYASTEPYTDYFDLAFLAKPAIGRVLFIGAGGAAGPREFRAHDSAMIIDVVDIDPKVLEIARTHFFLDDAQRVRQVAEDGRMFLRRAENKYDCIILDAFSAAGRIPFHLATREFLELCRQKMTADGVFLMNINSALEGPSAGIFHSMDRTLQAVFPNTYAFAVDPQPLDPQHTINIIFLGTGNKDRISPAQWLARAASQRSKSHITSDKLQQMVKNLMPPSPGVAGAPIFSDDYAPIETMAF